MNPILIPVFIVAIVFGFVLMVVKMYYDDRARGRADANNSLTTAELERMIEQAVADATAQLEARVHALEARQESAPMERQLGAAGERLHAAGSAEPFAADDADAVPSPSRAPRRTR